MDGAMVSLRLSPTRMPSMPLSQPEITSPTPAAMRNQRLLVSCCTNRSSKPCKHGRGRSARTDVGRLKVEQMHQLLHAIAHRV